MTSNESLLAQAYIWFILIAGTRADLSMRKRQTEHGYARLGRCVLIEELSRSYNP